MQWWCSGAADAIIASTCAHGVDAQAAIVYPACRDARDVVRVVPLLPRLATRPRRACTPAVPDGPVGCGVSEPNRLASGCVRHPGACGCECVPGRAMRRSPVFLWLPRTRGLRTCMQLPHSECMQYVWIIYMDAVSTMGVTEPKTSDVCFMQMACPRQPELTRHPTDVHHK